MFKVLYKLDPCQYFSQDAMLKMTVVELKKNSNNDMYLFIEKGFVTLLKDI